MFLPPHTTHLIQPLDDVAFATFKRKLANARRQYINSCLVLRELPKGGIQQTITEVVYRTFTPEVIIKSWTNTGLWPFDEEVIRQRVNELEPAKDDLKSAAPPRTLSEEIKHFARIELGLHQPLNQQNVGVVPEPNKIYLGSELVACKSARQSKSSTSPQQEGETEPPKKSRKRKRTENQDSSESRPKKPKVPQKRTKKVREEVDQSKYCRACNVHRPETKYWWTCPTCGHYKLCRDHAADVSLVETHRMSCHGGGH